VNPQRFLKNALKLEKKKLILPSLIVLTLSVSIIGGLYLRDGLNYDEKFLDEQEELFIETQRAAIEEGYFPNKSRFGTENSTKSNQLKENLRDRIKSKYSAKREIDLQEAAVIVAPILLGSESYLVPLTPSSINIGISRNHEGLIFKQENGYVYTNEVVTFFGKVGYLEYYREENFDENSFDVSLEEYRGEIDQIIEKDRLSRSERSKSVKHLKNDSKGGLFGEKTAKSIGGYENYKNDEIVEIGFIHFIPSLIATFILYYLISGFLIELVRTHLSKLNRLGYEDGSFFRTNLAFSIPSSLFIALIISVFIGSISGGYGEPVEILAITSIPVIAGFGVLSYFLKRFDGRAWIISGIALGFTPIVLGLPTYVPVILALALGLVTQIGHHYVHKLSFFDDSLEN
jgi:hypothetical protein